MDLFGRRRRREEARMDAEELESIIRLAGEDTTLLGEQLSALGRESAGVALDERTREDYQGALDAYEAAKRAVPRLTGVEEISAVVDTLTTGRYLLACVRASIEGLPRPELRTPCFFNPQHGPSVRDVRYTVPGGHGTRMVAVCPQDLARVEAGEQPKIRKVWVHGEEKEYWHAGQPNLPYGRDWFSTGMLEAGNRPIQDFAAGGW